MHSQGVCHRDLKLENLVLDSNFNLKLTDFGLACKLTTGFCDGSDKVGTLQYMAPEVILEHRYKPEVADLFSIGVIIFMLFTGKAPFEHASTKDKWYKAMVNQGFKAN